MEIVRTDGTHPSPTFFPPVSFRIMNAPPDFDFLTITAEDASSVEDALWVACATLSQQCEVEGIEPPEQWDLRLVTH